MFELPTHVRPPAKRDRRGRYKQGRGANEAAWVNQIGKPRWFDLTMIEHRDEFKAAVLKAMDDMARKIASRI